VIFNFPNQVRHKADLASLICRTRSDQTIVLKQKSRVELGLKSKSAVTEILQK